MDQGRYRDPLPRGDMGLFGPGGGWGMNPEDPWGAGYDSDWSRVIERLCERYTSGPGLPELGDQDMEARLMEECERWQEEGADRGPSLDLMEVIFSNKPLADQLRRIAG